MSRGMKLFLGLSALALLVVVALPSKAPPTAAAAPAVLPATPPVPPVAAADLDRSRSTSSRPTSSRDRAPDDPATLQALREHLATLTWGRDPFTPPSLVHVYVEPEPEPEPVAPGLDLPRLTGISRRGRSVMAILDHQIVSPGQPAGGGFVVLAIGSGAVTLLRDGEQHVLTLSEGP